MITGKASGGVWVCLTLCHSWGQVPRAAGAPGATWVIAGDCPMGVRWAGD